MCPVLAGAQLDGAAVRVSPPLAVRSILCPCPKAGRCARKRRPRLADVRAYGSCPAVGRRRAGRASSGLAATFACISMKNDAPGLATEGGPLNEDGHNRAARERFQTFCPRMLDVASTIAWPELKSRRKGKGQPGGRGR